MLMPPSTAAAWPTAVLFDFDGVIVNSEPFHCAATQAVMAQHGVTLNEVDYYEQLIGFDDRGGFRHLFARARIPFSEATCQAVIAAKNRIVLDLVKSRPIAALPGAADFIRGLRARCILGICSGALRSEIIAMLDAVALLDSFATIVAGDDVAVGKPDPSGYFQTMRLLSERLGRSLTPGDCLVVEDAPKVAVSVRAAGFPVLGITSSHSAAKWPEVEWLVPSLEAPILRDLAAPVAAAMA
jgi:beta-phosphoglucomutase